MNIPVGSLFFGQVGSLHQADAMFGIVSRHVLIKNDIQIAATDAHVALIDGYRVVAVFFLSFGCHFFHFLSQHFAQVQYLHRMVKALIVVGQGIENRYHPLTVGRIIGQIGIDRPQRAPHITIQIKGIACYTSRSPQRWREIANGITVAVTRLKRKPGKQANRCIQ